MPLIATHELNSESDDPQLYNGFDCCRTHGILNRLLSLPGADPIYSLSRAMQGPAMEMMLRGILVDPMERDRGITDLRTRLHGINSALAQWVHTISGMSSGFDGSPWFYNSGGQIKHLFYHVMHLKPIETHYGGQTKQPMDEETLEKIRVRYPRARAIASAILACRDLKKQLEKLEMEVDPDWRMRTSINIAGTNEGRWSTSKSFTGSGGNLQNVDERLRRMFISDPGYKLLGIDKEQAEARWVGFLIGILFDDWQYLDLLESGDGHTAVARMVWEQDFPWTGDIKKDRLIAEQEFPHRAQPTYRQACKVLSHATNILGKPRTISVHTGIPEHLVQQFQEKYFTALPGIPRYQKWLAAKIQISQRLTNPFGRTRDFFDRPDAEETVRKAAAFMQASPNADDINLGGWRMWKYMGNRIQLLTQEHDAWYLQFREDDDEEEIIRECQRHLNVVFDLGDRQFSVPTEAKVGWNKGQRWKIESDGSKSDVNPRGLDKPGAKR